MAGKSGSSPKAPRGRGKARRSPRLITPSPARNPTSSPSPTRSTKRSSSVSKSKAHSPSKSKARSPSKSKGRSPSRKKSVTRDVKSPKTKRSPSRKASRSRAPKSPKSTAGVDSDPQKSPKPKTAGRPRRSRSRKSTKHETDTSKSSGKRSPSKGSERYVSLQSFNQIKNKFGKYSDDDDESDATKGKKQRPSSERSRRIQNCKRAFSAICGIISLPFIAIGLYILCNETSCVFNKIPKFTKYTSIANYIDCYSIVGYIVFITAIAVCSIVPGIGKTIHGMPSKQGRMKYRLNGIAAYVIIFIGIIGAEIKGIHINDYIVRHSFQLLIAALVSGFVISIYVYIRSFFVPSSALNPDGLTKSRIYNYFIGREINPRAFRVLDMKFWIMHIAAIGSIIMELAYFHQSVGAVTSIRAIKISNINPTIATSVILHVIYCLDALIHEATLVTTMEVQSEGFGYLSSVGGPIYPFISTLITKYIYDYGVRLSTINLIFVVTTFTVGFTIYRISNNQKSAFRRNPYDPSLAHLETIPTSQGKKLIASGIWGIVRHPNYLGDILIHTSFIPFVICAPPIITIIMTICFLVHRSKRDNDKCKKKYGASWERYCNKVKYVLVPKVF